MQLAIKSGVLIEGAKYTIVVASHNDDVALPPDAYPGCAIIPYQGELGDLERIGDAPIKGAHDARQMKAPLVDLAAYAAQVRYNHEVGGIAAGGGSVIATDRASQALLTGAYLRALQNPDGVISFKATTGFMKLPASQVIAIGDAVADHVQACFAKEESVLEDLESGTINSIKEIDAAFAVISALS